MTGEAQPSPDHEISATQKEHFLTTVRSLLGNSVQVTSDVLATPGNISPEQHLAVDADRKAEYYVGSSLVLLTEELDLTGVVEGNVAMTVDTTSVDVASLTRVTKREEYEVSTHGERARRDEKTVTRPLSDPDVTSNPVPAPADAPVEQADPFDGMQFQVLTQLREAMKLNRFTMAHFDEAMKVLQLCGPHNRLN
ncbi:MAG: hypothetical protein JWM81_772 [Candidatus Saccharibacteria bacterium]|nr:hypothetical protein [Candidatus Saccharibacteria bacterium]